MTPTVLLLEDDRQLSDTIKQFLGYKGYEVYCAYDGYQAQDLVYEKAIDIMLLDVKVPLLNGFDFLKTIREQDVQIPAIFITSLNSVDDVEAGFAAGCDDYIRKPFSLKELFVRIESLLKRDFGARSEVIDIADELTFNIQESILKQNNKTIPLKTKELKLLSLFLRHENKLLSYDIINKTLWDYDQEPSSGSLRAYVKRLRAIIGKERIETHKNIGYRYVK